MLDFRHIPVWIRRHKTRSDSRLKQKLYCHFICGIHTEFGRVFRLNLFAHLHILWWREKFDVYSETYLLKIVLIDIVLKIAPFQFTAELYPPFRTIYFSSTTNLLFINLRISLKYSLTCGFPASKFNLLGSFWPHPATSSMMSVRVTFDVVLCSIEQYLFIAILLRCLGVRFDYLSTIGTGILLD